MNNLNVPQNPLEGGITMAGLFDEFVSDVELGKIRNKARDKGWEALDVKDILVVVGRHFNEETAAMKKSLSKIEKASLYIKICLPVITGLLGAIFVTYLFR
jgi:hypothetical protein